MFGPTVTILAVAVLATLSAGSLAYAVLYGRIRTEERAGKRLSQVQGRSQAIENARARLMDPARRRRSVQEALRELDERNKARARRSTAPPLSLRLEQAGLDWSRRKFLMISLASGSATLLAALLGGVPLYAALALGFAGAAGLPRWFVDHLRKRRIRAFLGEFPNAVDVIVRGVKAGLPLNDCIRVISSESEEPVRTEFRHITDTQSLGISLADAVMRLPERVPVAEANFFAIVIAIQQKSGGNLAEILNNLSRVIRDRKKMKGKIAAMSMEAKASAAIIGALPLLVMLLVYITSPDYIMILFEEPLGNIILGASAVWMLLGVLVMRRMINFEF